MTMLKTVFKAITVAATLLVGFATAPNAEAQDFKYLLWQKKVADAIAENQRYPRSAVRSGVEGQAQIRLIVKKDGKIAGFEVVKATGDEVLDREIERLVNRINPLPAVPGEKAEAVLTMPLVWSLQ